MDCTDIYLCILRMLIPGFVDRIVQYIVIIFINILNNLPNNIRRAQYKIDDHKYITIHQYEHICLNRS